MLYKGKHGGHVPTGLVCKIDYISHLVPTPSSHSVSDSEGLVEIRVGCTGKGGRERRGRGRKGERETERFTQCNSEQADDA